jgi:hypothetical protein
VSHGSIGFLQINVSLLHPQIREGLGKKAWNGSKLGVVVVSLANNLL